MKPDMVPSAKERIDAVYEAWVDLDQEPDIEVLHERAMQRAYDDGFAAAVEVDQAAQELIRRAAQLMRTSDLPHNRMATLESALAESQMEVARLAEVLTKIATLEVTKGAAVNLASEALGWPVPKP